MEGTPNILLDCLNIFFTDTSIQRWEDVFTLCFMLCSLCCAFANPKLFSTFDFKWFLIMVTRSTCVKQYFDIFENWV